MEKELNKEVAPGMTVEEIKALFFDANALREPAYKVYQLNSDGHRYYYFYDGGEPVFYPSVTTMLKQVMPTPYALIKWIAENGEDGATEKRDLAAAYGTFMHAQFEGLLISRKYDFDAVPAIVQDWLTRENLPDKCFDEWCGKIRKDVLAFAQFVRDYTVRPLAIEIGLVHPEHHYAGCIDLPCLMVDPKTGEEFAAIVDFKSGRKGFYEEHEIQLHLYMMMWNVNFPDVQIARCFNFSPKDWRTKPSYNLKEQTESPNAAKVPHLLALAAIEDDKREKTFTIVRGVLDLDNGPLMDNVCAMTLAELVKGRKSASDPVAAQAPEKPRKRAVKRASAPEVVNSTSEAENALKTENSDKLPWEDEAPAPALFDMAEQNVKDNLLNTEIEL